MVHLLQMVLVVIVVVKWLRRWLLLSRLGLLIMVTVVLEVVIMIKRVGIVVVYITISMDMIYIVSTIINIALAIRFMVCCRLYPSRKAIGRLGLAGRLAIEVAVVVIVIVTVTIVTCAHIIDSGAKVMMIQIERIEV